MVKINITEEEIEEIVSKQIEAAKDGDIRAARFVIELLRLQTQENSLTSSLDRLKKYEIPGT